MAWVPSLDTTGMPHSVEAEQFVLGSIMLNNGLLDMVGDILTDSHFFDPVHTKIFNICKLRIGGGALASPVTVGALMAEDPNLKELGGPAYLVRMASCAINPQSIREYAVLVIDCAARRSLLGAIGAASGGIRGGEGMAVVQTNLQHALLTLPEASGAESSVSLLKAITEAVSTIHESFHGKTDFLRTGIASLDSLLRGLGRQDYMVLGGATSMGKTSLALEIASRNTIDGEKRVAFWSLEMSQQDLAVRMAAAVARVPYSDLRDASDLPEKDFKRFVESSQSISQAPMRIIPKHIRDISAGDAAARRIKRELGGLDLMIVDYAQLVRTQGNGRYEKMTEASIRLKEMAGTLDCPVIALVQLDRSIGEREDTRPNLNDIKETGQFENDADQAIFCHRPEYYLERKGPKPDKNGKISTEAIVDFEADLKRARNKMEIIVRKNRHGSVGMAEVGCHIATNRFWSLDGGADPQVEQMEAAL